MAVSAHHDALLDLGENARPASVRQGLSDVERLIAQVVELEYNRVGFAAIDAGVGSEVLDQVRSPLQRERTLPIPRLGHVSIAIRLVVLPVVLGSARSAEVVELSTRSPPPREV
jgi:hypothetical protein